MEILENLDPLLKTFWYIAIPVSVIFLIQTIMTFIGADASDGIEADFDGDLEEAGGPFQLFSFRNLVNFLLGFSWTGISFYSVIGNRLVLVMVSVTVGILFIYLFFVIIRQLQKLAEDNTFRIADTLHRTGEAYTPVPERKSGKGKVTVSIRGALHELDAMTEGDRIASHTAVRVVRIENNEILIVEPIK